MKKITSALFVASVALGLSACATTGNNTTINKAGVKDELDVAAAEAEAEGKNVMICEKVRKTGTRLYQRRCVSPEQRRFEREEAERQMREVGRRAPAPSSN